MSPAANMEVQYKASTPTGIFEQAVAFFVRCGIDEFQPGKLSKGIRDSFRKGGVRAATEFAQEHANRVGRRLYRSERIGFELMCFYGHADPTGQLAAARVDADREVRRQKSTPALQRGGEVNSLEG